MSKLKTELVNAQKMHLLNPDTFDAPLLSEVKNLPKGAIVKIATGGERFWVRIIQKTQNGYIASVDNDLVSTDVHGLYYNSRVAIEPKNIFSIYKEEEEIF